jgi:hypothetical protein
MCQYVGSKDVAKADASEVEASVEKGESSWA